MTDFLAVWVALYGAHDVADQWVQGHGDAAGKGDPGWRGRWHCARHVLTYGATQAVALVAIHLAFGLDLNPVMASVGMAINLGTHYFADRRFPLRWVATLIPGKVGYYDNGGAPALDQAWHKGWILVSALIMAL